MTYSILLLLSTCLSPVFAEASDCPNLPDKMLATSKEVFVQADGAQLFCRVFGHGSPLIVIHGGPGLTQDYLLPQMAELAKNNLVIFYDQRACGSSTGAITEESISIETFVADLESIRKSFGATKVNILGHSWGGFLAMMYALAHPDSIETMTLLSTAPASSKEASEALAEFERRLAPYQEELATLKGNKGFAEGDPTTVEKYYRMIFQTYCFDPHKVKLLNLSMPSKAFLDGDKVCKILDKYIFASPYDFHDQLKKLRIPTLIVHGDFDLIPLSAIQRLHESIRGSQFVVIKNCGHFPYVETPKELFESVSSFLQKSRKNY